MITPINSPLETQLERLLNESAESALGRQQSTFDELASPFGDSLVLCGAGGLGRKTLAGLRKVGIEPLAFVDNNVGLHGKTVEGLRVYSPAEAASQFGNRAVFIMTIWGAGGGHRHAHTRLQLTNLGCQKVASFAYLFWKFPHTFLPYYCLDSPAHLLEHASDVREALNLWSDEASRQEYVNQVKWRLTMDFDGLSSPVAHDQYFPEDLLQWLEDEVFVDCGAFDGDTLKSFLHHTASRFKHYFAFEPDPLNFNTLESYVLSLPDEVRRKISAEQLAMASQDGKILIDPTGTAASVSGTGSVEVRCARLDNVLQPSPPTFIKLDIEGAEPDALAGASTIIKQHSPAIAVCVYHVQDHLWRIPLYLRSLSDKYEFFLRPHNEEGWDLICYCIPKERVRS